MFLKDVLAIQLAQAPWFAIAKYCVAIFSMDSMSRELDERVDCGIRNQTQVAAERTARIPLGHRAAVDDQAEAIRYMASPWANSVSGLIMNVDGSTEALSLGGTVEA